MDRAVKIPGPDHPITIAKNDRRVTVSAAGKTIVETHSALTLKEASYPAVQYVPRADADMMLLHPSDHKTYCPYKGECSYFHVPSLGDKGRNAVWSYEAPYDAVSAIREHLAFYPDRVTIEAA
ncbi:MAG TPA: DUF427 domain-containing protein [Rhizomicrobium sp.]|nr:DUF427 domain-containing protein [Rhizomicrobium sp.]